MSHRSGSNQLGSSWWIACGLSWIPTAVRCSSPDPGSGRHPLTSTAIQAATSGLHDQPPIGCERAPAAHACSSMSSRSRACSMLQTQMNGPAINLPFSNPPQSRVAQLLMRPLVLPLGLAVAYFITGYFGLQLALYKGQVTLLWPPTGLSLVALLIFGRRLWPAVWLGAWSLNLFNGLSPGISALVATGYMLAAVVGCAALKRDGGFRRTIDTTRDVAVYVVYGSICASMISASIGATSLCLGGGPWADWREVWIVWWLGDAGGVLTVGTFLLVWASRPRGPIQVPVRVEVGILTTVLIASSILIFYGGLSFAGQSVAFLPVSPY